MSNTSRNITVDVDNNIALMKLSYRGIDNIAAYDVIEFALENFNIYYIDDKPIIRRDIIDLNIDIEIKKDLAHFTNELTYIIDKLINTGLLHSTKSGIHLVYELVNYFIKNEKDVVSDYRSFRIDIAITMLVSYIFSYYDKILTSTAAKDLRQIVVDMMFILCNVIDSVLNTSLTDTAEEHPDLLNALYYIIKDFKKSKLPYKLARDYLEFLSKGNFRVNENITIKPDEIMLIPELIMPNKNEIITITPDKIVGILNIYYIPLSY